MPPVDAHSQSAMHRMTVISHMGEASEDIMTSPDSTPLVVDHVTVLRDVNIGIVAQVSDTEASDCTHFSHLAKTPLCIAA